jgi:hypothetical protein
MQEDTREEGKKAAVGSTFALLHLEGPHAALTEIVAVARYCGSSTNTIRTGIVNLLARVRNPSGDAPRDALKRILDGWFRDRKETVHGAGNDTPHAAGLGPLPWCGRRAGRPPRKPTGRERTINL